MPIIVGIDGTGGGLIYNTAGRNRSYDDDFRHSFVRRLCLNKSNATYQRGPITPGGGLTKAISAGEQFIAATRTGRAANEPILLTGFSRGGLGVLVIARNLQRRNIPVEAMMLFDAVDMHVAYSVPTVPTNVKNVLHVRRNPATRSRSRWGNCGLNPNHRAVNYAERYFLCTHGAMGGTPQTDPDRPNDVVTEFGEIEAVLAPLPMPMTGGVTFQPIQTTVTYRNNPIISNQVWQFVQPFLRQHKFI